jgi:hypothetical protein
MTIRRRTPSRLSRLRTRAAAGGLRRAWPGRLDCHEALVLEAAEELDQEERVSPDLIGFVQKLLIGVGAQNVHGDLRDGLTRERAEPDHLGPRFFQPARRALQYGEALVRAVRHHPAHGQGCELPQELPHRFGAAISGQVEVIKADEQRTSQRCLSINAWMS